MPKKRTSLLTYCLVALWLGFWFVVIAQAVAQAEPAIDLPSDNEDRLTLGQGMVAEVDFEAPAEHAALGYALKRRWQSLRDKGSDVTFSDYIKSYIAAFSKKKANNPRVK